MYFWQAWVLSSLLVTLSQLTELQDRNLELIFVRLHKLLYICSGISSFKILQH